MKIDLDVDSVMNAVSALNQASEMLAVRGADAHFLGMAAFSPVSGLDGAGRTLSLIHI